MSIDDLSYFIPESFLEYDWNGAIEENDGETVSLLEIAAFQTNTLKSFPNQEPSPSSLACLILWTRNYTLVQSIISLLQSRPGITRIGQYFSNELLWRAAFELQLQLIAIVNKPEKEKHQNTHIAEEASIVDKLYAYLAWCLSNDIDYHQKITQRWRLDKVWDESHAEEMNQDPLAKQIYRYMYGEDVEVEDRDKRIQKKSKQRKMGFDHRSRYLQWAHHPLIEKWYEKIRDNRIRSFFR